MIEVVFHMQLVGTQSTDRWEEKCIDVTAVRNRLQSTFQCSEWPAFPPNLLAENAVQDGLCAAYYATGWSLRFLEKV